MITKQPTKKIIGAKTRAALEKQIKAEEQSRWYPISEIKFFEYDPRTYQVLLRFGKGAEK
ncbi:hypothetical protein [Lysinibacillus sphaericus]|uniref:hypothetical protein n=1 Tax=Lysinibacillus sphaericus TaxID=1421 RepID=UPI001A9FB482|nr:hypothetical protein [Lysinibacillus sphaericus]QTB25224.1 hypothetical protein J2D51_12705 [Lysinibacillus sphaericus]